jgi:hypothetical protein
MGAWLERVRDFFPKGTDFSTIANPKVAKVDVCSMQDLANPSASVLPRFSTPSLTLKVLCAGNLNRRPEEDNEAGEKQPQYRKQAPKTFS